MVSRHLRGLLPALLLLAACATGPAVQRAEVPAEAAAVPARPAPGRIQQVGTPTGYDLVLRVDPRQVRYDGETWMHLDLAAPTPSVFFHAVSMEISRVEARVGDRTIPGEVHLGKAPPDDPAFGEAKATFEETLPAGPVTIHFVHSSPFDPHLSGLYRGEEAGRWYAFSQFEVADARKTFPCIDEPSFKVPFRITVSVPEGMKAFSNTPAEATTTQDGWTTVRFAETKPLPTYLVAFAIGDLDVLEHPGAPVPLRALTPKGRAEEARDALALHADFVPILEAYFGRPYPYRKLDAAAAVQFGAGAMENAGLITYREEYLLAPKAAVSASAWEGTANTVAHELAHQWFGDLVTMAWWDDIWLNESFATWMAARTVDAWDPQYEQRLSLLSARGWVFEADALASAQAVRQPVHSVAEAERSFSGITYTKGANVLAMLEHWMGEDVFRDGIRRYLDAHAYGNATSEDLMAALSAAAGQDVGAVAGTFLDRPGVPLVSVEVTCEDGGRPSAHLRQTRYRPLGSHAPEGLPEGRPWTIPVCLAWPTGSGAERAVRQSCFVLGTAGRVVPLEDTPTCPAWVHPNAGEYGYYHWAVAPAALPALADAVRRPWGLSEDGRVLERSRLALLNQVGAMVRSGTLSPSAYLPLLAQVLDGADPATALRVAGAVSWVAETWPELADTPAFAGWVRGLFEPTARRLGFSPRAGEAPEVRDLRLAVLGLLGWNHRAPWVEDEAVGLAKRWIDDPSSVSPGVGRLALQLAAHAGRLDPARLKALATTATAPNVRTAALGALGYLPPGAGLEAALDFVLTPAVRQQDLFYVLRPALSEPESRDATFAWVYAHWDALTERLPPYGWYGRTRFAGSVGSLCDAETLGEARRFFEAHLGAAAARPLALGTERADQCIALRGSGRDALAAWLAALPSAGAPPNPAP